MNEERDFNDFQIECPDKEHCVMNMEALNKSIPRITINIIHSRGKYYIEPGVPLIRSWEKLVWKGEVKNFKEKYIDNNG